MTDTRDVEKAFLKVHALHALMVGAKVDADTVDLDVALKLKGLKAGYEEAVMVQAARSESARTAVGDAENDLKLYQEEVRKSTGAVIDLMPVVIKGSTRL